MPPEWLDLGYVGQGGGGAGPGGRPRPRWSGQHAWLPILGTPGPGSVPTSMMASITITTSSSAVLLLLRGFIPRDSLLRQFLFPLLHKVWHAGAEAAVIRVIS